MDAKVRARVREEARAAASRARQVAAGDEAPPGLYEAVSALADAVDLLADVSEAQEE